MLKIQIEMEKENLNATVEMTASHYQNGKLKTVFGGKGQISMRELGRILGKHTNTLTFRTSDCGTPKMEVDYYSKSTGNGESVTDVAVEVKGQILDKNEDKLVDAIAAGAKLTKADAGYLADETREDFLNLQIEIAEDNDCSKTEIRSHSKLTKADAGRNLDGVIESTK